MKTERFALAVRKLTLAPVLAGVMLCVIRFYRAEVFLEDIQFAYSILFLTVFPVLAYPLQKYIPRVREQGRDGQRRLAMVFEFLGCLCECLVNLLLPVSHELKLIGWTYFLAGAILLIVNRVFHIKLSGHAAGAFAVGMFPVLFKIYWCAVPAAVILALVFFSSIWSQRHTLPQLLGGTCIPIVSVIIVYMFL